MPGELIRLIVRSIYGIVLMMPVVFVRLFQELNEYIPLALRRERVKTRFSLEVEGYATIASLLMRLGVPPDEVDLVTVDGESVSPDFRLADGAEVNVYPVFERFDVGRVSRFRSAPLRVSRFELDAGLEELARLLRNNGFDAELRTPHDPAVLIERARREHRIVLSRNPALVHDKSLTHYILIHAAVPQRQLEEVLSQLQLDGDDCVRPTGR